MTTVSEEGRRDFRFEEEFYYFEDLGWGARLITFDILKHCFRLCVEFTVKPDKVDAFHEEFSKCVAISVKEAGCKQVRALS